MKNIFFLVKCLVVRLVQTHRLAVTYKGFSRWKIRKNISTLFSIPIINKRKRRILQKEYYDIFRRSNSLTYENDQLCFAIPIPPVFSASFRNNPVYPNNYVSSFLDGIQNISTIREMVVHLRISRFFWNTPNIGRNIYVENEGFANRLNIRQPAEIRSADDITNTNIFGHENALITIGSSRRQNTSPFDNSRDDYHVEWIRLASFANFESPFVHPIRLARNGWYSRGNTNQVVCFSCSAMHDNWIRGENPNAFHHTNCRFINNTSCNIPIRRSSATDSRTVQGFTANEDNNEFTQQTVVAFATHQRCVNPRITTSLIDNIDKPRHLKYAGLNARYASFVRRPFSITQAAALALAGFFCDGNGDHVRCFFCDGGLRDWNDGDDPWVEHARWFSTCGYLRDKKGS